MKNRWSWLILALVVIISVSAYFSRSALDTAQPYEGTQLSSEAPDFQLIDQNGSVIKLSDFRERIVVLTFMDSKCQDTCPLTAAHFRAAYRELNSEEAGRVVFLGVNVNAEASTASDMLEATHAWRLDEISIWHFLTGNPEELEPVWEAYGVAAIHSADSHSMVHTPGTFLIDSLGQERWYISTPFSGDLDAVVISPLNELLLKHIREILRES